MLLGWGPPTLNPVEHLDHRIVSIIFPRVWPFISIHQITWKNSKRKNVFVWMLLAAEQLSENSVQRGRCWLPRLPISEALSSYNQRNSKLFQILFPLQLAIREPCWDCEIWHLISWDWGKDVNACQFSCQHRFGFARVGCGSPTRSMHHGGSWEI